MTARAGARRAIVLLTVPVAVLAAGCGGGGDESTTAAQPAGDWAQGLCSAALTWKDSLGTAVDAVKGHPSKDTITSAADDAESATKTFVDDVKALGVPQTESGQLAKDEVDNLADQLESSVDSIKQDADDVSSGKDVAASLASIAATAGTMVTYVKEAVTDIQGLDATGELETAFRNASSCKELKQALP